jgi:hypothetical protein
MTLADTIERPLDISLINGVWVLATIEAGTTAGNHDDVRLWDVTSAILNHNNSKTLLATLNLTSGFTTSGGNGAITWGAISGGNATLYAMSVNNGIQAFNVTVVPEPATASILALAGLGLGATRRRRQIA